MGVDALAIDGKLGEFFLHGWLLVQTRLARIEQGRADQYIRDLEVPLNKGEGGIAV